MGRKFEKEKIAEEEMGVTRVISCIGKHGKEAQCMIDDFEAEGCPEFKNKLTYDEAILTCTNKEIVRVHEVACAALGSPGALYKGESPASPNLMVQPLRETFLAMSEAIENEESSRPEGNKEEEQLKSCSSGGEIQTSFNKMCAS